MRYWPVGRFFNTTGPVVAADHYCIPPLDRLDLREVLDLVRTGRYFVLHAPRQTGKTSALLALRDLLNGGTEGEYRCVYVNVEVGQAGREDVDRAMRAMLTQLAARCRLTLGDDLVNRIWPDTLQRSGPDAALQDVVSRLAEADPRPLVLLIDEIEALVGDTLLSVLRQLRAGYDLRPAGFPQSVVLCGVRDVRDAWRDACLAGTHEYGRESPISNAGISRRDDDAQTTCDRRRTVPPGWRLRGALRGARPTRPFVRPAPARGPVRHLR
ncbi:MAG: ATP-binding protein [Acidobacteria bacterium]|nr:ATP-binding protein [Acidobacteriota bacterium]